MTTFDAFYDDYIDFKSYVNDILNAKFKNIAESAEKELNGEENKTENENRMNLENKIQNLNEENVNLRAEVKSYEKVIQLLTSEKKTTKTLGNPYQENIKDLKKIMILENHTSHHRNFETFTIH